MIFVDIMVLLDPSACKDPPITRFPLIPAPPITCNEPLCVVFAGVLPLMVIFSSIRVFPFTYNPPWVICNAPVFEPVVFCVP